MVEKKSKKNISEPRQKPCFLVCVNDKEHSRTALKFACAKALSMNADVAMLSVVDPLDYHTIFSVADVIKEERLTEARQLLNALAKDAQHYGGITPKKWVREGLIDEAICEVIEEKKDIVMLILGVAADGSSNKGGILTSLTEKIGDKYHIPLLLVPGNLTDQKIDALN